MNVYFIVISLRLLFWVVILVLWCFSMYISESTHWTFTSQAVLLYCIHYWNWSWWGPGTNLGSRPKFIPCVLIYRRCYRKHWTNFMRAHTSVCVTQSGDAWLMQLLSSCSFCVVMGALMWLLFHDHPACRTYPSGEKQKEWCVRLTNARL